MDKLPFYYDVYTKIAFQLILIVINRNVRILFALKHIIIFTINAINIAVSILIRPADEEK